MFTLYWAEPAQVLPTPQCTPLVPRRADDRPSGIKAKKLVQTTNLRLVDIALEFGFHRASTFSRNFKRNFGVAPTMFRASAGALDRSSGSTSS